MSATGARDRLQERVDEYLRTRMHKDHIPATAAAIVRDGEMLYCRGHGLANLEWETPASEDTAFQLASATKPLTGTLIMMLVEAGKLRLEALLAEYLPQAPPFWERTTVRHLATHTSGLSEDVLKHVFDPEAGPAPPDAPNSTEEIVAAAAQLPLAYEPGSKAEYGLTDFVVLTAILERVGDAPFQTMLHDRILDPLGMTSTSFDNATDHGPSRVAEIVPRRASLFYWREERQEEYRFLYPAWSYAAGGIYSSAADLARWAVALDRGELLRPDSVEEMFTPQTLAGGEPGPFSPGWHVYAHGERRVVGHSGGPALGDIARFRDDGLTAVVLTNQRALHPDLTLGIADIVFGKT
jgi:CubicO group peptidase (beta-lactamase class C family)